jgi:hypothetical protein
MELTRLVRVLRDRWRIVALIATIGFAAAFGFTSLANRSLDISYEALIAMRYDPQEDETIEDLALQINEDAARAVFAAETLLAQYGGASIFADTGSGKLYFKAVGDTADMARERAQDLLSAYLQSDVGGNLDARLEELIEAAAAMTAEIEQLQNQTVLSPEEQALLNQHQVLDLSIAAVRDQIVALTVADAGLSAGERQENAERRAELEETLNGLIAQKATLGPAPSTELNVADRFRLAALQRNLELMGLDYERIYLQSQGVLGSGGQREAPIVNDLTPEPASPVINGVIGLIGGAALAMFALVFVTRSRKEVWLADDLPIPILGEVPLRKVTSLSGPSWYDSTAGGRRKESVQAVRTAIDGLIQHEPAGMAIVRDHVGAADAHALAVDLAASFASAGRSVLLIAADYFEHVDITEYDVGEPSLGSVLRLPPGPPEELDARINDLLDNAVSIRTDLAVMPAGPVPESPADSLAGPQFRRFLTVARERFDLVLAVGGDPESSTSQVLMQRLGAAILALAPGKTTMPRVNAVLVDLSQQRVQLPGAIMLHGTESRISLPAVKTPVTHRQTVTPVPEPETVSRLRFYPFPGSKRSVSPTDGSLDHLVEGLAVGREHGMVATTENGGIDPFGAQVADALESADRSAAFGPVAEYVVARVEDMMTAVPGQTSVSEDLVGVVFDHGFIPLTAVKDVPTVWHWLVLELENEVGIANGQRIAGQIARILTGVELPGPDEMDRWLSEEFFSRHVQRTDREPDVWHITSPNGAVQLLVNGRRLTDEKLGRMTMDIVRRRIHELERALKESRLAGEADAATKLEDDLKDAHLFEISLGMLRGGSSEEARLVYPWRRHDQRPRGWSPIWSEGVRPNIAPLQRLDLLPQLVLTEEELEALVPTG